MKTKNRVALLVAAFLVMTLIGTSYPQSSLLQPVRAEQLVLASEPSGLTSDELISIVSQAHYNTVQLFSSEFEAELYGDQKLPWSEVRLQLVKHWSPDLVDEELESFYSSHLNDWGYEMGFVFPLWQPEMIEDIIIVTDKANEVVAEFKVPINYETSEYIQIRLICINGNWVIASPFVAESI